MKITKWWIFGPTPATCCGHCPWRGWRWMRYETTLRWKRLRSKICHFWSQLVHPDLWYVRGPTYRNPRPSKCSKDSRSKILEVWRVLLGHLGRNLAVLGHDQCADRSHGGLNPRIKGKSSVRPCPTSRISSLQKWYPAKSLQNRLGKGDRTYKWLNAQLSVGSILLGLPRGWRFLSWRRPSRPTCSIASGLCHLVAQRSSLRLPWENVVNKNKL